MAEQISLTNLANLQNENTAVTAINNNNTAITSAFADVLSRTGVAPNNMESVLDMDGNRIINLIDPISGTEPVTVAYLDDRLADLEIASGLTGVPVSTAMQPVVNATTVQTAQALMGVGAGVTPQMFGAVADGVINDTTAINAAIAYCNSTNYPLIFPKGTYLFNNPLTTCSGTFDIIGTGVKSILKSTQPTGAVLVKSGGGKIADLYFDTTVVRTAGATLDITANGVLVSNVWIDHPYLGISNTGQINTIIGCHIGISPKNTTPLGNVPGITSRVTSANSGGIYNSGILTVLATTLSSANNTVDNADYPEYGIRNIGELDICGSYVFLFKHGILNNPPNGGNSIMGGSDVWLDGEIANGILFDASSGGICNATNISSFWITAGSGGSTPEAGIQFKGVNVGDIDIVGCEIIGYNPGVGKGIWLNGTGTKHINITGCLIKEWQNGFYTEDSNTNWTVVGGEITSSSSTGVRIGSTNDHYAIVGVNLVGNTGGTIANFSNAAPNKKIAGCPGFNVIGAGSIGVRNSADTGTTTINWDTEGRITSTS